MRLNNAWIGKSVTVKIDRPLGSIHPQHPGIVYEVNYGYIPGTMADDGEEIDAYVLGVDMPVDTFEGRVIAIIHRDNDIEDKLVVAPYPMDSESVYDQVSFQEQYFESRVEV